MAEQTIEKQEIVIVWFKRDLRFTDHEALFHAQKQSLPILLLYCFEPSVMEYHDSGVRHWRFVYQSLREMMDLLRLKQLCGMPAPSHGLLHTHD